MTEAIKTPELGQELIPRTVFKKMLDEELKRHVTIDHPLVGELVKPEKNLKLLQALALQGYQLTKNFLEYIEKLYFYCPLDNHKKGLLINLYEEETGKLSNTKNHVHLMEDFVRALGISDEERDAAEPYPETKELIEYRMDAVNNPDEYHIGAAAVMIASEGQSLETRAGEARHSILGKIYGLSEKDVLFFSVHQEEDVGHVNQGLALVSDLCTTPKMQEEAMYAVKHTCELFYGMNTGVYNRYCA